MVQVHYIVSRKLRQLDRGGDPIFRRKIYNEKRFPASVMMAILSNIAGAPRRSPWRAVRSLIRSPAVLGVALGALWNVGVGLPLPPEIRFLL